MSKTAGRIRAGIGGWTYEPWEETFYPADLPKKSQLNYASRQVTAIEINGTFYRLQKPDVFAKWRDDAPEDFVFSIKAPRYLTYRKVLSEALPSVPRFLDSGLSSLQQKLGPILWQLPPTLHFDGADIDAFLAGVPRELDGRPLRHVLEVRHKTFMDPAYVELARKHSVATVFAHTDEFPNFADVTADFVYARLRKAEASEPTGYSKRDLKAWSERARLWASGGAPDDLPYVTDAVPAKQPRDVFIFFINGAKQRAPAAAKHLLTLI
ncbi:DUF72 domain-containing protein [Steroidobacter sp. S1-65]|uniref:DUF72 domain-containing protein n=1 Tax=Steroidobacter gossypii TaxID=2805490 RepID=A0ABS1WWH4_9GAMM|nr:DUF72 domain-containing protein [Steroidobacter gossypii]MBM0105336.1 DUF72 domain-containing protein [Steroidobacter gossypii]